MKHQIKREQWVDRPLDETFNFFKEAKNLEKITPPYLHFRVLSQSTPNVQEGTRINYLLFLRGLPMWWQSEIVNWKENQHFMDIQRRGPYKRWEHLHAFKEKDGGTLVIDEVTFEIYFEKWMINFIRRDVDKIFDYRVKKLDEIFRSQYS